MAANFNMMRAAQMGNMGALAFAARSAAFQTLNVRLPITHALSLATLVAQPPLTAANDNHAAPRMNTAQLDAAALVHASARFLNCAVHMGIMTRAHTAPASTQLPAAPVNREQTPRPISLSSPRSLKARLLRCAPATNPTAGRRNDKFVFPIVSAALLPNTRVLENIPQAAVHLPQTPRKASVNMPPTKSTDAPQAQSATDLIVPLARGIVKQLVPLAPAQLERARAILRAAGVSGAGDSGRDSFEVVRRSVGGAPRRCLGAVHNRDTSQESRQKSRRYTSEESRSSHPFRRSHTAGKSPAFLVSNLKPSKSRKAEPAQIVRVATTGPAKRRIVFARVPGTRGEYRLVGIDHEQKPRGRREPAAPHALIAPTIARELPRAVLSLAPRSAGESAYTMPDPRELREDEREALVGMLKEQLALGPASLNDPSIREQFNGFMFSNTVGEMSHYVTADQWNAMVRATVLYAARAVLPFSNNSITQVAASQLFKEAGAQTRYTEWIKHFGIAGLGDIALMDIFLADDRILTMPEYFLKGILDHLLENAQELQGYDEDVLPLPFASELHLQWETIAFINDPAITTDAELIDAATSFVEEIAALDTYAAQHFLELVLLSTMIKTDSIQGVWNEDQAIALVASSIEAGMSDVVDPIGKNRQHPRRMRRLVAIAKETANAADVYKLGFERLIENLDDLIRRNPRLLLKTDPDDPDELHAN